MPGLTPAFLYAVIPLCLALGSLVGISFAIDSYPPDGLPTTRIDNVKAGFAWLSGFCLTSIVIFTVGLVVRAIWNVLF